MRRAGGRGRSGIAACGRRGHGAYPARRPFRTGGGWTARRPHPILQSRAAARRPHAREESVMTTSTMPTLAASARAPRYDPAVIMGGLYGDGIVALKGAFDREWVRVLG